MYGGVDSFTGHICKGCERTAVLEKNIEKQQERIDMLEEKLEELLRNKEIVEKEEVKHYEEHKSQIEEMEERLNRIKMTEEKMIQITLGEKTEEWSTVVKRNVDKDLKAINEKVKKIEESIERNIEEKKLKEKKIILSCIDWLKKRHGAR